MEHVVIGFAKIYLYRDSILGGSFDIWGNLAELCTDINGHIYRPHA